MTDDYVKALSLACRVHAYDRRKGKDTPYIAHLLAVSSMVLDDGGTEDEAIAALLHDTLEDHPDQVSRDYLEKEFSLHVADIVQGCSDTPVGFQGGEKPPWKTRKENYLKHLKNSSKSILRVAVADKLHNARELLTELETRGERVWDLFNANKSEQLWYFENLLALFEAKAQDSIHIGAFRKTINALRSDSR